MRRLGAPLAALLLVAAGLIGTPATSASAAARPLPTYLSLDDDVRQLVTVTSDHWSSTRARMSVWRKRSGTWQRVRGPARVRLGWNGWVPAGKRRQGYYVLPFLLGDRFAARLCLKADRATSTLVINTAHAEADIDRTATVEALARELSLLMRFLGLAELRVKRKGDLAGPLRKAIGA